MSKPAKTVGMRVLEAHHIEYEPKYYEVVEHLSAAEVAAVLGLAPEQTFKTLVALPERTGARPILALVPGDSQLDLKKLAQAGGEKKVQMAALISCGQPDCGAPWRMPSTPRWLTRVPTRQLRTSTPHKQQRSRLRVAVMNVI